MTYAGMIRAQEAARRRQQREAQKSLRDLERRAKELEKLSALERARLEVETYEKRVEVLFSVHKEQGETWDWIAIASSLAPLAPTRLSIQESKAKQRAVVTSPEQRRDAELGVVAARALDELNFQEASNRYAQEKAHWENLERLAARILGGDHKAYVEALVELSPLAELVDLGSSIHFTVHSAKLICCELKISGRQAIPAEHKSLTASGKVSVKTMPKARFHEIYQDYVCGCMLRVAREVFAVLPVDTLLITALADVLDPRTGQTSEQPVLSAAMGRTIVASLHFDSLDPSNALENFQYRGDFKASRKLETFQPIVPLDPADVVLTKPAEEMSFREILAQTKGLHEEIRVALARLLPSASPALGNARFP